jgi:hypothetical protein
VKTLNLTSGSQLVMCVWLCLSRRTVPGCVNTTARKRRKRGFIQRRMPRISNPPSATPLVQIFESLFGARDIEVRNYFSLLCVVLCFIWNISRSYWSIFLVLYILNGNLCFSLHLTVFKAQNKGQNTCLKYSYVLYLRFRVQNMLLPAFSV